MGIESNKEAMAMMKKAIGSIENRFREAYNKGYKDGLRDGASQVTEKLVSKMLAEIEADTPQTETPHACKTCPYHERCSAEDWRTCHWDYVSERYIEPQTERSKDDSQTDIQDAETEIL